MLLCFSVGHPSRGSQRPGVCRYIVFSPRWHILGYRSGSCVGTMPDWNRRRMASTSSSVSSNEARSCRRPSAPVSPPGCCCCCCWNPGPYRPACCAPRLAYDGALGRAGPPLDDIVEGGCVLSAGAAALAAARGPPLLRGCLAGAGRRGGAEGATKRGVRRRSRVPRCKRLDQDLPCGGTAPLGSCSTACM